LAHKDRTAQRESSYFARIRVDFNPTPLLSCLDDASSSVESTYFSKNQLRMLKSSV